MTAEITLVPDTSLQFWEVPLNFEQSPLRSRDFWELRTGGVDAAGKAPVELRPLVADPDTGAMTDPMSGSIPPEHEVYTINRTQALEPFLDRWVPLPYFGINVRDRDGHLTFLKGPSNWARALIVPSAEPKPDHTHTLVLAFDTTLHPQPTDIVLCAEDSVQQRRFNFVADFSSISWFLNEGWIGAWLVDLFCVFMRQRRNRELTAEDFPHGCEHFARYVTFLELLALTGKLPQVRLIDTCSSNLPYQPVSVDLVLDVGNSRTCGLLIEEHRGQGQNLADSYPLVLRDLTQPWKLYDKPFASQVEFAQARFGSDKIARRSGINYTFSWPSLLRVGPEATRLATQQSGTQGASGLSSPKRYLWDERPIAQFWRFNGRGGRDTDSADTDPPVRGALLSYLAEDGQLLVNNKTLQPAFYARFSRSSLFTLMLVEILMQAICQINSPSSRMLRRDADKPRELRQLVLTLPPGMPVFEQYILHRRTSEALKLCWQLLGWPKGAHAPPLPRIVDNFDEATATQIVWLHNEVTCNFAGNAGALFATLGRERSERAHGKTLRVASIDVGGGTTDLMVITYAIPSGERLEPEQDFRESFKIAGDDVVHHIITALVIPAVEAALKAAGAAAAHDLLVRMLAQDLMGQSEQQRQARRVFVSQVLEPMALAILATNEKTDGDAHAAAVFQRRFGDLLGTGDPARFAAQVAYLEDAARDVSATGFAMADVEVTVPAERVDTVVRAALGQVIADLCEVVWHYDCDILLLSGRPTKLRAVVDMVLAKLPLPPHRIIKMHHYRVGPHYPFRDAANRIDDPKTTVVVGAMLCVQAEGQLQNFSLPASKFRMRSTARIIGRMDNDGQIRNENVLLSDADLDEKGEVNFKVRFYNNLQIGFRQIPIERWTSTPLYHLEFAAPDAGRMLKLPLTVEIRRCDTDPEKASYEIDRERFMIEEVLDAEGAPKRSSLILRLQTMDDQAGYWRDTGRLNVS